MPRLIIREKGRERVVEVDLDKITIGRSRDNTIAIGDEKASRAHCAIQKSGQGWYLLDLGSSNGTLLNGKPVQKELISLGDMILIGSTEIHFERVIEDDSASQPKEDSAYLAQLAQPESPKAPPAQEAVTNDKKFDSVQAQSGGAKYLIKVVSGENAGATYPLGREPITIGRRGSNTITIDNERVSGKHAQISKEGSVWILTDFDSTNGTIVRGRRIKKEILEHGTVFSIGGVSFQFVDLEGAELPPVSSGFKTEQNAESAGLPSDADFERIDVQKALKTSGGSPVLNFIYGIAGVFLLVSVVYFAFQVFGQLLGRSHHAAKAGNLAANWSFEQVPGASGELEGWITPESGWEVTDEYSKTGEYSLVMDCSVNNEPDDYISTGLRATSAAPDRIYQVKTQLKLQQARRAGIKVTWSDPLNPYFVQESYSELLSVEGGNWQSLRWDFIPPEKATRMQLSLCAFGNTGKVWFDDVEIYEKEPAADEFEMRTVTMGDAFGIEVDNRGTWSFWKLGATALWDAQFYLTDKNGRIDLFSRQSTSNIQKKASVSGGSMLYLGYIYLPEASTWAPLTQEIYTTNGTMSVRYKLTGEFNKGGRYGIMLSARHDILGPGSPVEISTKTDVQFFESDFVAADVREMVWGAGENVIAFGFQEPVDIKMEKTERGLKITLTREFEISENVQFVVDFSEISQQQQQKIASLFESIEQKRYEGKLRDAIEQAEHALREYKFEGDSKSKLQKIVNELKQEGEALVNTARHIYDDFKKSKHPELLNNLDIVVEQIKVAYPSSEKTREAQDLLESAKSEIEKVRENQMSEKAGQMLLKGDSYRGKGMLGLAAVYYEYVRDNFAGTEFEKDAKAKLQQLENQIKHEGKW